MDKQNFKCSFIYHFGVKPNKEDMAVAKEFVEMVNPQLPEFALSRQQYIQLMSAFCEQMPKKESDEIQEAWELMGGKEKGFITI